MAIKNYGQVWLESIVCQLASWWDRERRDKRITDRLDPSFMRLLDDIEKLTRGDDRRCVCFSFKTSGQHDIACPAYSREL